MNYPRYPGITLKTNHQSSVDTMIPIPILIQRIGCVYATFFSFSPSTPTCLLVYAISLLPSKVGSVRISDIQSNRDMFSLIFVVSSLRSSGERPAASRTNLGPAWFAPRIFRRAEYWVGRPTRSALCLVGREKQPGSTTPHSSPSIDQFPNLQLIISHFRNFKILSKYFFKLLHTHANICSCTNLQQNGTAYNWYESCWRSPSERELSPSRRRQTTSRSSAPEAVPYWPAAVSSVQKHERNADMRSGLKSGSGNVLTCQLFFI